MSLKEVRYWQNKVSYDNERWLVGKVKSFKYLEYFDWQKNGVFDEYVKYKIKCGRIKWRESLGVLCDKKIPMRLK